jgi:hypothetical protein
VLEDSFVVLELPARSDFLAVDESPDSFVSDLPADSAAADLSVDSDLSDVSDFSFDSDDSDLLAVEDFPELLDERASRASFLAQPLPLNTIDGVLSSLRIGPPQTSQAVGPVSCTPCSTSTMWPQLRHW